MKKTDKLTLGFSPCPNDTYIFDAMVHGKIDTEGLEFDVLLADVEELNRKAFRGDLAITKLSFHAYAYLTSRYALLDSGSALGFGNGPLLIAKKEFSAAEVNQASIAIPGEYTTANFLFSLAYPGATHKTSVLFSDIEAAVLSGEFDAGLIIHENRFTYEEKGLKKIIDLGNYWEKLTQMPIPLGGIAVRRDLPKDLQQKINRVMRRSVEYGLNNPEEASGFIVEHAQEMDKAVMYKHIGLYVNEFTANLGETGKKAIITLFDKAVERGLIEGYHDSLFV